MENPRLGGIIDRGGEFSIWYGIDRSFFLAHLLLTSFLHTHNRRVWLYTTHFNRLLNIVCMHPDSLSETFNTKDAFGDSQDVNRDKSRMMEIFQGFDPRLVSLLDMAEPSSVRLWQLFDMDPPPTRHKGRLVLVGDAALPFLPHIGQGAACALEDAACMTTLFGPGIPESDIAERMDLYEECRKTRAEEIHSFSRLLGHDLEIGNEDAKLNRELMAKKYFPYIFGHDEFDHSAQKLREHEYRKALAMWSMPTSFGPTPRFDQIYFGPAANGSTHVSSTITFKTSKTLLQNLLPSSGMSFTSIGTVALASFTHTEHLSVGWLAGQSYSELTFYIHSLRGKGKSGGLLLGSDFLVVSLVDSPDVLVRARENFGIPMVFCNFAISELGGRREIKALWNNRIIYKMALDGIEEGVKEKEPIPEPTVLTHRYLPGIGAGHQPAADSIICLSRNGSDQARMSERRACVRSNFDFVDHSPQELPTLHHIIKRLAELPILQIVDGYIIKGIGSCMFDQGREL